MAFDLVLALALLRLTASWQPALATLLAVLVTGDAVLTLIEALAYNVPRLCSAWDVLIVLIAVAGPALSAFLLWRGRLHRSGS